MQAKQSSWQKLLQKLYAGQTPVERNNYFKLICIKFSDTFSNNFIFKGLRHASKATFLPKNCAEGKPPLQIDFKNRF